MRPRIDNRWVSMGPDPWGSRFLGTSPKPDAIGGQSPPTTVPLRGEERVRARTAEGVGKEDQARRRHAVVRVAASRGALAREGALRVRRRLRAQSHRPHSGLRPRAGLPRRRDPPARPDLGGGTADPGSGPWRVPRPGGPLDESAGQEADKLGRRTARRHDLDRRKPCPVAVAHQALVGVLNRSRGTPRQSRGVAPSPQAAAGTSRTAVCPASSRTTPQHGDIPADGTDSTLARETHSGSRRHTRPW
mmetsp:Transcript_21744/g.84909  ORF Transcript_21744/g.84909 Transcript_21744/m.84909 type:complete len:247 (-) Transcript_21744:2378-3118(-)